MRKLFEQILIIVSLFFLLGAFVSLLNGIYFPALRYFLISFFINPIPFRLINKVISKRYISFGLFAFRIVALYTLIYFNIIQGRLNSEVPTMNEIYSKQTIEEYSQPPQKNP